MCHWCTKLEALQGIDSQFAKPILLLLAKLHKAAEPYYGDIWLVRYWLTAEIHDLLVKSYEKHQSAVLERMIPEMEEGVRYIKMHMRSHPPNHLEMGRLKGLKTEIYPHESASNEVSKGSENSVDSTEVTKATKAKDNRPSKKTVIENRRLGKRRERGVRQTRKERLAHRTREEQVPLNPEPASNLNKKPPSLTETPGSDLDPSPQIQEQSIRAVMAWLNDCNEAMLREPGQGSDSDVNSLVSFIDGSLLQRPDMDVKLWSRIKSLNFKGPWTRTVSIKKSAEIDNDPKWSLEGLIARRRRRRSQSCSSHDGPPQTLLSQSSLPQPHLSENRSTRTHPPQPRPSHICVIATSLSDCVFDGQCPTLDLNETVAKEARVSGEARRKFFDKITSRIINNMSKHLRSKGKIPLGDAMKIIKARETSKEPQNMMSEGVSSREDSDLLNTSVKGLVHRHKEHSENRGSHRYNPLLKAPVHKPSGDEAGEYGGSGGEKPRLRLISGDPVPLTEANLRKLCDKDDTVYGRITDCSNSLLSSRDSVINLGSVVEQGRRDKSLRESFENHLTRSPRRRVRRKFIPKPPASDSDFKVSHPRPNPNTYTKTPSSPRTSLKKLKNTPQLRKEPGYTDLRREARREREQESLLTERDYRGAGRREGRQASAVQQPVHTERAYGAGRKEERQASSFPRPVPAERASGEASRREERRATSLQAPITAERAYRLGGAGWREERQASSIPEPVPAERTYRGASRREERRASGIPESVLVDRAYGGASRKEEIRASAPVVDETARREARKYDRRQSTEARTEKIEELVPEAVRQRRAERARKTFRTDKYDTKERQKHWDH